MRCRHKRIRINGVLVWSSESFEQWNIRSPSRTELFFNLGTDTLLFVCFITFAAGVKRKKENKLQSTFSVQPK